MFNWFKKPHEETYEQCLYRLLKIKDEDEFLLGCRQGRQYRSHRPIWRLSHLFCPHKPWPERVNLYGHYRYILKEPRLPIIDIYIDPELWPTVRIKGETLGYYDIPNWVGPVIKAELVRLIRLSFTRYLDDVKSERGRRAEFEKSVRAEARELIGKEG